MYFCSKSSALLLLVSKWCYAMRKLLQMPRFWASGSSKPHVCLVACHHYAQAVVGEVLLCQVLQFLGCNGL